MNISQLIAQLERVRAEHGDLLVMTPGFDESGLDLLESVDVERVAPVEEMSHSGSYESVKMIDGKWRIATGDAFDAVVLDR